MALTLASMQMGMEKAFPMMNTTGIFSENYDADRFLVTLRHGTSGAHAVVKYFKYRIFLCLKTTNKNSSCANFPKLLNKLFQSIKDNYHAEMPRTRKSIKEFLMKLETLYDSDGKCWLSAGDDSLEQLRFANRRMLRMIHDLNAFLQTQDVLTDKQPNQDRDF